MQLKPEYLLSLSMLFLFIGMKTTYSQTIVQDSSLEEGHPNTYWAEHSLQYSRTICDATCGNIPGAVPRTGNYSIWIGGSNVLEEGSASQTVLIPNTGYARLIFYFKAPIMAANVDDYFKVFMDSTVVFYANAADSTTYKNEYKEVVIDITAFADGRHHILKFFGHQTGNPRVTHYLVDDIAIKVTVGIEEAEDPLEINVYPNPASDFVYLKTNKSEDLKVIITSIDGKIISEQYFKNATFTKLNISTLPKGFYLIIIENNNKKIVRKLIVE